MGREEQITNERLRKIKELEKKKINPYPNNFDKKNSAEECLKAKMGSKVKTAGRLMTKRELGKIAFAKLRDVSGDIQLVLQEKKTPDKIFDFFGKYIDAGDFVGVEGEVFKTKTGEISILIKNMELLSKAILPLPEKFHGLQDDEEKFRKRYLDVITNPEVRELFKKRGETINAIRDFLIKRDFLEVDTPVLQPLYGGANAKPFITHYNVYNKDVYLRIAPELYLKRLIVAVLKKFLSLQDVSGTKELTGANPEFSLLEFYQAYIDYNELMKITEELIIEVIKKVNGKAEIERDDKKILIKKPFKKITFKELTKGKMTDESFKEAVRKIKEPTFVINHPLDISPLAKKNDEKTVQRFQLIIDGIEVVNAFSELNDPIDQEERFREQEKKKSEEKHKFDKDFVEALKYGMPPTGGFGMGIDRFVMLITGSHSVREILLFPFMKPDKE